MKLRAWVIDTGERAASTAAEAVLVVTGMDTVDALELDWKQVAGVAAGAFFVTVLKCLAALRVKDSVSPASLVSK